VIGCVIDYAGGHAGFSAELRDTNALSLYSPPRNVFVQIVFRPVVFSTFLDRAHLEPVAILWSAHRHTSYANIHRNVGV
jgi:hypothetical protein